MPKATFTFPVGYEQFHRQQLFNFQLNRWYSLGYARFEDMQDVGPRINDFRDWKSEMIALAEKAVADDRYVNAAFYFRAAEFYLPADDPDKETLYERFIEFFHRAFRNHPIERFRVPYGQSFLPGIKVPSVAQPTMGTIVVHGGFDSFIEEFYSWMDHFSRQGFDVIAFEGPGQGAARRKYGLFFDYEWEKPAKAVLDHFGLDDVTWLGISMGGWLCFRAAAFESRIKRVIASSIAYDYSRFPNAFARLLMKLFFSRFREFSDRVTLKKMKKDPMHAWSIGNLMYISGKSTPMEAADVAFQMNAHNQHPERVSQDVLILTGRDDHFVPYKMHKMQVDALTSARSVKAIVFTKEDHAQNHCQIGNCGLALETIVNWITKV